jgi:serine/threonine protein kinase
MSQAPSEHEPTLRAQPTPPPATAAVPHPVASSAGRSGNALKAGTRFGELELCGVIGEGGFGIVYTALDHSLERQVALKEYMPASLAARGAGGRVEVRSDEHREAFEAGRKSFVNEARLLAQFDHPALLKVYRFWEANDTAYMAMPLYQGVTLKDRLRALAGPPDEAWLMAMIAPLTEALAVLHAQRCYHRDIAPDNVLLLSDGERPLLLDFGAARRVIGDITQALTVILKPGYAPIEQYADEADLKQGPWTDVYALAAVL